MTDLGWRDEGACRGVDPNLFFPVRGESTAAAKAVCRECPVRQECLEWALANNETHGIWGGASERERKRMRRRMIPQCGTNAGYRRHIALEEAPCGPCLDARDAYWDARKARNPVRGPEGDRKERNVVEHRKLGWCHACARSDHRNCQAPLRVPCSCPRHGSEEIAS